MPSNADAVAVANDSAYGLGGAVWSQDADRARAAHPMVPLDLFRSRSVSIATAVGFAFVVGFYGLPIVPTASRG